MSNSFESFKSFNKGKLDKVNNRFMWTIMRWSSGHIENIRHCNKVNKYFFFITPDMSKHFLHSVIKTKKMCRYPNYSLTKEVKTIIPHLKKIYKVSTRELLKSSIILEELVKDRVFIKMVDKMSGMSKQDLKVFNIKQDKVKPVKVEEVVKIDHGYW